MRNSDIKRQEFKKAGAVLVTGASGGFGLALAFEFAKDGFDLVIVSKNAEKLKRAKKALSAYNIKVYDYVCDLSNVAEAKRLYTRIKEDKIPLCGIVNNAGFGAVGECLEISDETDIEMTDLNVKTPVILTKAFLRDAKERGRGFVLNVCSVGAFQPGPYNASYYASKAYLYNYTLAVRYEMKKYGLNVSAVCPGPLKTDFFRRAGADTPKFALSAEEAAKYTYKKLWQNKKTVIPGFLNRAAYYLPQSVKTRFVAGLREKTERR